MKLLKERWRQIRTRRGWRLSLLGALALLLAATVLFSLGNGALKLDAGEVLSALLRERSGLNYQVIFNIRLPRVLLGLVVGAALAVAGAILQGVMRNPLASPNIIGVSAGGGLGAVLIILALPQFAIYLVPAAFAGAMGTALLIYLLAWRRGVQPVRLILSGIAVASMLGAITSVLLLFHAEKVHGILDFTIGSLAARSWEQFDLVWPYAAAGLLAALLSGRSLNILALGDEIALNLGMRVELTRFALLAVGALLAALAVSVAGLLGFVGLIAPHMARLLIGSDYRYLLPGCALFGAALVVLCDTLGRLVMEPSELPAGIILALLGPPFFLSLLRRGRGYEEA